MSQQELEGLPCASIVAYVPSLEAHWMFLRTHSQ